MTNANTSNVVENAAEREANALLGAKLPASKIRKVEISAILRMPDGKIDTSMNDREQVVSYDRALDPEFNTLFEDIEAHWKVFGSLKAHPVLMELPEGKFQILQGFRRVHVLEQLGIPSFTAVVYPTLTKIQVSSIMLDGVIRKGLNKAETFYAIERQFEWNIPQRQIVQDLKPLLMTLYPRSKQQMEKIGNDSQKLLDSFRGVIQGVQRVVQNHRIVRDNYVKLLKGEQNYPKLNEVKELYDKWNEDTAANKMLTRSTPIEKLPTEAPKFWEKWSAIIATVPTNPNEVRDKSTSMKTRKDIENLAKMTDCIILRMAYLNILRTVDDDQFKKVTGIQFELEKAIPGTPFEETIKSVATQAIKATEVAPEPDPNLPV